ncbi:sodium:solute symporter family protein [Archaeoglobus sp.]
MSHEWLYLLVLVIYFMFLVWYTRAGYKRLVSLTDFTTAGYGMGLFVATFYFVATWVSVASTVGVPSMLYLHGMAAVTGWFVGWFGANALMPFIGYKYRRAEAPPRTAAEYLRIRFEPYAQRSGLQAIAALTMVFGYFIYIILQIKGFGMIISQITGVPYTIAVLVFLIFLIYAASGGQWSVGFANVINALMIIIGIFGAAIAVLWAVGGWEQLWLKASLINTPPVVGAKPTPLGMLMDPVGTFGLSTLAGIVVANSIGASVAPHWTNMLVSVRNTKVSILYPLVGTIFIAIVFLGLLIIGLGGRVLIPTMPEGKGPDWLVPMIFTKYVHPVVGAIGLAAIAAAAVSTASAMLLPFSLAITYDIVRNLSQRKISDQTLIKWTRVVMIVGGVIMTVLAINPPQFIAMAAAYVFGLYGSVFIVPFYLGLYWKRSSRAGAYASTITGMILYVLLDYLRRVGMITLPVPAIVIAVVIGALLYIICAYIFPPVPKVAYEPFFEPEISEETRKVWRLAKKEE